MMPWDAQQMQPDTAIPAAAPEPIPVVATNTVTGQQIGVDISGPLRAAIDQAIKDAVTANPILGRAVKTVVRDSERADWTIMQSSMIDVAFAAVAALFTVIAPDSPTTGVLWLAAAVLASRTMVQAAIHRLVPEAT
jgi:hypothetical protein